MGNGYYYNLIGVYINYAIGKALTYNRLGPVKVFYSFKRIIKYIIKGIIKGIIRSTIGGAINSIIKGINFKSLIEGIINNSYGR